MRLLWHHPILSFTVMGLVGAMATGWVVVRPYLHERRVWKEARQALDDDDLVSARTNFETLLPSTSRQAEAHFQLGRVCRLAGDTDAARQHLSEARQLGWSKAAVTLEDQLLQAQLGFARDLEGPLQQHLSRTAADTRWVCEAMVRGYLLSNLLDEAYRWSRLWVEQQPDDWLAHDWAGRVLEAGQRQDLAAEAYQAALDCRPARPETHFRLAEVLAWKGRWADALAHYQSCLESDAGNVAARLGLARCQRVLTSPEAARATLDAIKGGAASEHAGVCLLRGQLELDAGQPAEALAWLRRADKLAPFELETCQALAATLRLLNRPSEAEAYETRRRQIHTDLKRMAELNKELTQHRNDVGLLYEAGVTLLRLGRQDEAVRWLVSAFLLDRHHQPTRQALTEYLKNCGDAELVARYRRLLEAEKESK
jgi:tetratricopeptide (TPR) repeat protein